MRLLLVSSCDALTRQVNDFADAFGNYSVCCCADPEEACAQLDSACNVEPVIVLDLSHRRFDQLLPSIAAVGRLLAADDAPAVIVEGDRESRGLIQSLDSGTAEWIRADEVSSESLARTLSLAVERFRTRRALQALREETVQLWHSVPILQWSTGTDLSLRRVSGLAAELIEGTPLVDSLIGRPVTQLLPDDSGGVATRLRHEQALQGERVTYETDCRGRRLRIFLAPLRIDGQAVTGTVGIGLDISDQREFGEQLSAARQVHESLLPRQLPRVPGVDIAGAAFPAHVTGGDWYDVLEQTDGSLALIVGDVSGHDLPATILAAACSAYLYALITAAPDRRQILATANQLVWKRTRPQDFAMLQLGWIDAERTRFMYAGAGDRALLLGADGVLKTTLASVGPPLGLFPPDQAEFDPPVTVNLAPGDALLLLTDGFREARNPAGEMFGEERIIATISRGLHRTADEILRSVFAAVAEFTEGLPPEDDMSGIIVRILDQPR